MGGSTKKDDVDKLCDSFDEKNRVSVKVVLPKPKVIKISKKDLFLRLVEFDEKNPGEIKILNVDSFTGDFEKLSLGNGGSWCRKSAWTKHKVATLKRNGSVNYLWDIDDDEKEIVDQEFSIFPITEGTKIQYIGIFGMINQNNNRPIRNDIKNYYNKLPCCKCGNNSSIVPDHKNDLYNDPRVLDVKTQTFDDFQSLCNSCNLQKRQVCKKTKETNKRYGATNIPMFKNTGIDFIEGDETYDSKDINAMKGTFWYDPVAFMDEIFKK